MESYYTQENTVYIYLSFKLSTYTAPGKNYEITTLQECSLNFFFYFPTNKLITDMTNNIHLSAEYLGFKEYTLYKSI